MHSFIWKVAKNVGEVGRLHVVGGRDQAGCILRADLGCEAGNFGGTDKQGFSRTFEAEGGFGDSLDVKFGDAPFAGRRCSIATSLMRTSPEPSRIRTTRSKSCETISVSASRAS